MESLRESEVSDHDNVRDAGNPGHDGCNDPQEAPQEIGKPNGEHCQPSSNSNSLGERPDRDEQEIIEAVAEEEASSVIKSLSKLAVSSGPIPRAEELNKYKPDVQEKIIDWHDREIKAMFDDESRRQDKLVDAEIARLGTAQVLSFILDILLICGPFAAFLCTGNPQVFWVYTVFGASVIGNIVINVNRKKKDEGNERRGE